MSYSNMKYEDYRDSFLDEFKNVFFTMDDFLLRKTEGKLDEETFYSDLRELENRLEYLEELRDVYTKNRELGTLDEVEGEYNFDDLDYNEIDELEDKISEMISLEKDYFDDLEIFCENQWEFDKILDRPLEKHITSGFEIDDKNFETSSANVASNEADYFKNKLSYHTSHLSEIISEKTEAQNKDFSNYQRVNIYNTLYNKGDKLESAIEEVIDSIENPANKNLTGEVNLNKVLEDYKHLNVILKDTLNDIANKIQECEKNIKCEEIKSSSTFREYATLAGYNTEHREADRLARTLVEMPDSIRSDFLEVALIDKKVEAHIKNIVNIVKSNHPDSYTYNKISKDFEDTFSLLDKQQSKIFSVYNQVEKALDPNTFNQESQKLISIWGKGGEEQGIQSFINRTHTKNFEFRDTLKSELKKLGKVNSIEIKPTAKEHNISKEISI